MSLPPTDQRSEQPPVQQSPAAAPLAPVYYPPRPKDPDTAFILELLGGFFGFLGLGHLYMGQTDQGLIRLLLWFVFLAVAWVSSVLLTGLIIGCFCIPPLLAMQVLVPIWSAYSLKNSFVPRV